MLMLLISFEALSQEQKSGKNGVNYVAPKLKGFDKFPREIICDGHLRKIYNLFNKDTSMFLYRYFFTVTKTGKIRSRGIYVEDNPMIADLNRYIKNYFNKYTWSPGYMKNCSACKLDMFMELRVFFRTDINLVNIELELTETNPEINIYKKRITYAELTAYTSSQNCDCCK